MYLLSLLFITCLPPLETGLTLCMCRRWWHPTPVLLPGKSHGWRSPEGCSPWGRSESDRTEWLHFHFSPSCIGEGNGNPLQCSCLENPRDRGAWWAAVYGVTQSWTRLKWLSMVEKLPCETNVDTSICQNSQKILHKDWNLSFPGGPVVKNPPCNAGDKGSILGPGRSPMSWGNSAHVPQLPKPAHPEPRQQEAHVHN